MRTRGEGVKNPENFADVLYVWPLTSSLITNPILVANYKPYGLPRLMFKPAQIFIRPLVLLSTLLAAMTAVRGAPYNGWGPSEGYGHTGTKVPASFLI